MKRRVKKRESEIEGRKASASGGKLASGKGALSGEDHQACIHMSIEYEYARERYSGLGDRIENIIPSAPFFFFFVLEGKGSLKWVYNSVRIK